MKCNAWHKRKRPMFGGPVSRCVLMGRLVVAGSLLLELRRFRVTAVLRAHHAFHEVSRYGQIECRSHYCAMTE
jgi:hypothetical protein